MITRQRLIWNMAFSSTCALCKMHINAGLITRRMSSLSGLLSSLSKNNYKTGQSLNFHTNSINQKLLQAQQCQRKLSTSSLTLSSNVTLTRDRYPNLERGPYAQLSEEDVAYFEKIVPDPGQVIKGSDELQGYNTDWLKTVRGKNDLKYTV